MVAEGEEEEDEEDEYIIWVCCSSSSTENRSGDSSPDAFRAGRARGPAIDAASACYLRTT